MASPIPPPPPGFQLQSAPSAVPPPPPGFQIVEQEAPRRRGDAFDAARDVAWQLPQGFNRGVDAVINAPYNLARGTASLFGYELPEAQPIVARTNSGVEPEGMAGRLAGAVGESVGASVIPSAGVYGLAARTAAPMAANAGIAARTGNALLEGVRAAPKAAAAMDLASATGSGLGVGTAREQGWGPAGEMAAGFVGGLLPAAGAIGKSLMQLSPKQQLVQNELLDAGQRQGVPIPRAVQGGDVTRMASAGLKEIPFVGTPIQQGYDDAVQKLGERAGQVGANIGSGSRHGAGQVASDALKGWIKGESADINAQLYGEVDKFIRRPSTEVPLANTKNLVRTLRREQYISATDHNDKAIGIVAEALSRPGLTYQGVKGLRTVLGNYLSGKITPEAGTPMPAIKRLYGALTEDLRNTVKVAGGENGLRAFDQANKVAAIIAKRREQIATVVGKDGMVSPERVFDSVVRMASEKGGGDLRKLAIVRQAVGNDAWKEVQAASIQRLGRDPDGNFSPARFITAWGNLSDGGKAALFGRSGGLRQSLDDITTISREFNRMARLGNPSGTGRVNSLWQILGRVAEAAAGVAIYHKPEAAVALAPIVAGRGLAKYLGNPTTASAVRQFSRAHLNQLRSNSDATRTALNSAVRALAQAIAEEDGADPAQVKAAISGALQ
jgi:hypothetical protein